MPSSKTPLTTKQIITKIADIVADAVHAGFRGCETSPKEDILYLNDANKYPTLYCFDIEKKDARLIRFVWSLYQDDHVEQIGKIGKSGSCYVGNTNMVVTAVVANGKAKIGISKVKKIVYGFSCDFTAKNPFDLIGAKTSAHLVTGRVATITVDAID